MLHAILCTCAVYTRPVETFSKRDSGREAFMRCVALHDDVAARRERISIYLSEVFRCGKKSARYFLVSFEDLRRHFDLRKID